MQTQTQNKTLNIGKSTCCQSDYKGKRRYVSVVVPTLTTKTIANLTNGYYIYKIIILRIQKKSIYA
jgi:hypothetical protein